MKTPETSCTQGFKHRVHERFWSFEVVELVRNWEMDFEFLRQNAVSQPKIVWAYYFSREKTRYGYV